MSKSTASPTAALPVSPCPPWCSSEHCRDEIGSIWHSGTPVRVESSGVTCTISLGRNDEHACPDEWDRPPWIDFTVASKVWVHDGDIVGAIGRKWDELRGFLARPINFLINTVWNDGILRAWNKVREWIPGLPEAKPIAAIAGYGSTQEPLSVVTDFSAREAADLSLCLAEFHTQAENTDAASVEAFNIVEVIGPDGDRSYRITGRKSAESGDAVRVLRELLAILDEQEPKS